MLPEGLDWGRDVDIERDAGGPAILSAKKSY